MKILAVFLVCFAAACGADYTLGPDSQPHPGVPQGTVTKYELAPGRFYPGTPHHYSVYVPAQYNAAKPTPFMIFLDGSGALGNGTRANIVFDNLIAKHDLPPMIGIFIDPGVLPALSPDAQSRYNRIFEYDSLSDRFASFLIEELIPEVQKKYNLSHDPNDRGLSGNSTGAVGAFMAAWNRPDQFRRVISFIGTYVAMKGADALPALIRRTEPKPIRIFLQDGKIDHIAPNQPWGTFFAGSWPINNEVMYEAFEYAGYDVKFELGTDGHSGRQGAAILPDVLRWLWRGYPQPIEVHEPAALSQPGWDARGKIWSTVWAAKGWEQVGATYHPLTRPAGDRDGNVYFAEPEASRIYRSDEAGKVTVFRENSGGATALAVGADGRLYAAQPGRQRIVSYGAAGDEKVVAQKVTAMALADTAGGALYFVDTVHKSIGYIDAKGQQHTAYGEGGISFPSGVALSPDQAMAVVTDALERYSWSFQIAPDGSLINGEPFYRLEMPEFGRNFALGSAEDSIGQVYFATPLGVQVCEANGRVAEILNPPEHGSITSLAFAGKDSDWLYVTENGKLFRRPVKVRGVPAWTVAKLPKPPL
jgi:gluconolactonase